MGKIPTQIFHTRSRRQETFQTFYPWIVEVLGQSMPSSPACLQLDLLKVGIDNHLTSLIEWFIYHGEITLNGIRHKAWQKPICHNQADSWWRIDGIHGDDGQRSVNRHREYDGYGCWHGSRRSHQCSLYEDGCRWHGS